MGYSFAVVYASFQRIDEVVVKGFASFENHCSHSIGLILVPLAVAEFRFAARPSPRLGWVRAWVEVKAA